MKQTLLIFFIGFLVTSCNPNQPASEKNLTTHKDFIGITNPQDTLGSLISTIEFRLKANKEEMKDQDDPYIPWISLNDPGKDMYRLVDADEIVLSLSSVTLIIDYPLTNSATFDLTTTENGFSRKQLITEISAKYHLVYKEEEATSLTKTIPQGKRGSLLNRNETSGKYGIWGHDLGDLDLGSIQVYKNSNGKVYLILEVES